MKKLPKSLAAGFWSTVQEAGQIPGCGFYLPVPMSRDDPVVMVSYLSMNREEAFKLSKMHSSAYRACQRPAHWAGLWLSLREAERERERQRIYHEKMG